MTRIMDLSIALFGDVSITTLNQGQQSCTESHYRTRAWCMHNGYTSVTADGMTAMTSSASFFTTTDNHHFLPTEHTRGPWSTDHCHAGPPTALAARGMEAVLPDQRLTRLTIVLRKPVPMTGFTVNAAIEHQGRTVSQANCQLIDANGNLLATATGLFVTRSDTSMPTAGGIDPTMATPTASKVGPFPIQPLHSLPSFAGSAVETRYPPGEDGTPGPTRTWLKTVPLLPGETPSPFQTVCPMADCTNAMGRNAEPGHISFVNADLTILLHRDPVDDWIGSHSVGYWENHGAGMADAQLYDRQGSIGRALQTVILKRHGNN